MFASFLKKLSQRQDVDFPTISPDEPLQVIGDIHGRLDLLDALLGKIDPKMKTIFVGDYTDRGDQSEAVLRRLMQLTTDPNRDVTCLVGNHDEMLLNFMMEPDRGHGTWLRHGGLQTLASFGVPLTPNPKPEHIAEAVFKLRERAGPDMIDWLSNLPVLVQSGNVCILHAGADPTLSIESQPSGTLIWGHPSFDRTPRKDGIWVVHGHTIVDQPLIRQGRISIDTGAYATGHLTAAVITDGQVHFIST